MEVEVIRVPQATSATKTKALTFHCQPSTNRNHPYYHGPSSTRLSPPYVVIQAYGPIHSIFLGLEEVRAFKRLTSRCYPGSALSASTLGEGMVFSGRDIFVCATASSVCISGSLPPTYTRKVVVISQYGLLTGCYVPWEGSSQVAVSLVLRYSQRGKGH